MPITFPCECGRSLSARDEHAGKRVRCPGCSAIQTVPGGEAPSEAVTARPTSRPAKAVAREPAASRPGKPRPRLLREDANEDIGRGGERVQRERGSGSMLDKGVLGGLGMMLVAVVWFFGAGMFGIWFWYPPVLFVIGIICFIKGLIEGK